MNRRDRNEVMFCRPRTELEIVPKRGQALPTRRSIHATQAHLPESQHDLRHSSIFGLHYGESERGHCLVIYVKEVETTDNQASLAHTTP